MFPRREASCRPWPGLNGVGQVQGVKSSVAGEALQLVHGTGGMRAESRHGPSPEMAQRPGALEERVSRAHQVVDKEDAHAGQIVVTLDSDDALFAAAHLLARAHTILPEPRVFQNRAKPLQRASVREERKVEVALNRAAHRVHRAVQLGNRRGVEVESVTQRVQVVEHVPDRRAAVW